jgi:hypothetical protein
MEINSCETSNMCRCKDEDSQMGYCELVWYGSSVTGTGVYLLWNQIQYKVEYT